MPLLSSLNSHFTHYIKFRYFMSSPSVTVSSCSFR